MPSTSSFSSTADCPPEISKKTDESGEQIGDVEMIYIDFF
jgi:hypothetical protein